MRAWCKAWFAVAVIATGSLTVLSATADAHVHETVGNLELTFGWHNEPAFTGASNAIDLEIVDSTDTPVPGTAGSLTVEVSVGDSRTQLALVASDEPGLFSAPIIPTRAGTYSLHIVGTIQGQAVDVSSTCSEQTFECVEDPTAVQFPAKEPTPGQVADRLDREVPRIDSARSSSSSAHGLALAALAVSTAALVAAVGLGLRRGRKHT